MKIAIIGGGIAGLTLAWYLQKSGVPYTLFEESTEHAGGNFCSIHTPEGYLLEAGPNTLQLSPELEELLADLGLTGEIQDAAPVSQHRYVLRRGRYRELPGSPPKLLLSGFFSLKAKWQALRELWKPAAPTDPAETVASFFRRRFGPEIVDYAVNPFISGIYAGDPERLLIHKTFPQLPALEQTHGSVLRGFIKTSKGGVGRRRVIGLKEGNQTIANTLAAKLDGYRPGIGIARIRRTAVGTYQLWAEVGGWAAADDAPLGTFTHLALALPAYAAAPLLAELFPEASAALAAVRYPPMSAVFSAYDRTAVAHPLNGFGALNPKAESTYAAGSIWTSSIYPHRVPAGQVLFTTFVGGEQFSQAAQDSEDEQKAGVHAELSRLYGITGEPRWQQRYFWPRSIPQFDEKIGPAHAAADALQSENIVSVANWRAGVGVPDCIRHARQTAEKLAAALSLAS
ncbi:protoporphyrinogen oxidase [Hymenobacter sp. ASUV-10]|uniref:Coproporphyrinogen III oxidase n=1 Tax=Hymenobacter aranciens TaxID=3063996 RepID=A0ABT9BGD1_9BACT|nr:protoporphyrinogen oxidase [Hymenobacter sp. ASUV-10]MDO7875711.1 protoporphyrinogen oxidase [Hymenobacter sp. ASUV-10]